MRTQLPPVQISSKEAYEGIWEANAPALYITANVFLEMHSSIRQQLTACGYEEWLVAKRGVLYVKRTGPHPFDPCRHQLFLPIENIE